MVEDFIDRTGMNPRRFGARALGDPGFITGRNRRRRPMRMSTAGQLLAFMGEVPYEAFVLPEIEAFLSETGTQAYLFGEHSVRDPSYVCRLRQGRLPLLRTIGRSRGWIGIHCTADQRRRIWTATTQGARGASAGRRID